MPFGEMMAKAQKAAEARGEVAFSPDYHYPQGIRRTVAITETKMDPSVMKKLNIAECLMCDQVMEKLKRQIQICQVCLGNEQKDENDNLRKEENTSDQAALLRAGKAFIDQGFINRHTKQRITDWKSLGRLVDYRSQGPSIISS